jgi:hypothetical protein
VPEIQLTDYQCFAFWCRVQTIQIMDKNSKQWTKRITQQKTASKIAFGGG